MTTTTVFPVPQRADVSPAHQAIFDQLKQQVGFVPNLYASYAHHDTALGDYLALQNRQSTLRPKAREVINLVVSQVNDCRYCQSAHTALGKMHGFTDEQILEIRRGRASFDAKLDILAQFTKDLTERRGHPTPEKLNALLDAGYSRADVIDIIMVIGDKIISNFVHGVTQVAIDFPVAPEL